MDADHEQLEEQVLAPSSQLGVYNLWRDLAQGFKLKRHVTIGHKTRTEVRYGVKSLPASITPAQLARMEWSIENRLHYRRMM